MHKIFFLLLSCHFVIRTVAQPTATGNEQHRPLLHFSPKAHWMNDPNGMFYQNGLYHLFFQYYPNDIKWGPMHWGHATSTDMLHWKEQAIALYPDSLGYIFSGSAVVDKHNTSGFGKQGKAPIVAIFTHHNPDGEKAKRNDFQNESIAYSTDDGKTWTKYSGNPVLKNPGITDFRDPKVSWYEAGKKWIMTLATKDRITFYSSPNLKTWTKESEFGEKLGAHGGVWECPDLMPFTYNGKKLWVLLVSINPGGPNGGSATQYFVGDFDGKKFSAFDIDTKFMDYGTDNYAGVTFSNLGNRNVLIGWMSNWQYAQDVPTKTWRSAMTLPRELSLQNIAGKYYLNSFPAKENIALEKGKVQLKNINVNGTYDVSKAVKASDSLFRMDITTTNKSFEVVLSNNENESVSFGYDKDSSRYYIDRTNPGKIDFEAGFAKRHYAPRISVANNINLTLIVDVASVEVFADNGLTTMTDIFFPNKAFTKVTIKAKDKLLFPSISYSKLAPALATN